MNELQQISLILHLLLRIDSFSTRQGLHCWALLPQWLTKIKNIDIYQIPLRGPLRGPNFYQNFRKVLGINGGHKKSKKSKIGKYGFKHTQTIIKTHLDDIRHCSGQHQVNFTTSAQGPSQGPKFLSKFQKSFGDNWGVYEIEKIQNR